MRRARCPHSLRLSRRRRLPRQERRRLRADTFERRVPRSSFARIYGLGDRFHRSTPDALALSDRPRRLRAQWRRRRVGEPLAGQSRLGAFCPRHGRLYRRGGQDACRRRRGMAAGAVKGARYRGRPRLFRDRDRQGPAAGAHRRARLEAGAGTDAGECDGIRRGRSFQLHRRQRLRCRLGQRLRSHHAAELPAPLRYRRLRGTAEEGTP